MYPVTTGACQRANSAGHKSRRDGKGDKSRFASKGAGLKQWRERVDATPLDLLTADAIQQWKLGCLRRHKDSPAREHRAINTVNADLRNARSLFTTKALAFAAKRLALPEPLPFSDVKLESRRGSTRYSSRIDPAALLLAAKTELGDDPARKEQFKIFCLALLCGLRKREIDTLLWRSVDLDKSVIRIERTEYFQPKSEDSVAEVDVAPELVAIFRTFKVEAKGEFVIQSENPPRSIPAAPTTAASEISVLSMSGLPAKDYPLEKSCTSCAKNAAR